MRDNSTSTESKQEEDPSTPINNIKASKFTPTFVPKITFPNAAEYELKVKDGGTEFYKIDKGAGNDNADNMIVYDFQIRCTFHEKFELENFPFDCQGMCAVCTIIEFCIDINIKQ